MHDAPCTDKGIDLSDQPHSCPGDPKRAHAFTMPAESHGSAYTTSKQLEKYYCLFVHPDTYFTSANPSLPGQPQ